MTDAIAATLHQRGQDGCSHAISWRQCSRAILHSRDAATAAEDAYDIATGPDGGLVAEVAMRNALADLDRCREELEHLHERLNEFEDVAQAGTACGLCGHTATVDTFEH